MGIPIPAIKQKIILDKLNPDVIENPSLAYDKIQNSLLQEHIVDNPIMNKGNLLLEIKKDFYCNFLLNDFFAHC